MAVLSIHSEKDVGIGAKLLDPMHLARANTHATRQCPQPVTPILANAGMQVSRQSLLMMQLEVYAIRPQLQAALSQDLL